MDSIIVKGNGPLHGVIPIAGAKNACLTLMPATLLSEEPLTLTNAPRLSDIGTMTTLLQSLGAEVAGLQGGQGEFGRHIAARDQQARPRHIAQFVGQGAAGATIWVQRCCGRASAEKHAQFAVVAGDGIKQGGDAALVDAVGGQGAAQHFAARGCVGGRSFAGCFCCHILGSGGGSAPPFKRAIAWRLHLAKRSWRGF